MSEKIFGYDWETIRQAQQGHPLNAALRRTIYESKPKATTADFQLLEKHGLEWLYDNEMLGTLDRLGLPMQKTS